MKRLEMIPNKWPCTLLECPPGPFLFKEMMGFKSEYKTDKGGIEAYCDSGEFFWAGAKGHEERANIIVQPLTPEWIEYEE